MASRLTKPASLFDSLPAELHRIILGLLPDFPSLRSVVVASTSARAAYRRSLKAIQFDVFRRILSNSSHLATESQLLRTAAYIRCENADWHDSMDDFLACHQPDFEDRRTLASPQIVTSEGLYFHNLVEDFTNTLLEAAMPLHQIGPSALSQGNIEHFPLQYAEGIRIQRAFYRIQRICQTYPRVLRQSQGEIRAEAAHPLADFVWGLPSWELEELHCTYRFLLSRLSFLDGPAYSAFVRAQCVEKRFSSSRYKEHIVSMGLIFLRNLITAPIEIQLALLTQYCGLDSHSLSDVLSFGGTNASLGVHASARSLDAQSLLGPSAGWVLYRPPTPKDRAGAPMNELRNWGYCFWERDRLVAWGVSSAGEEYTDWSSWAQRIRDTGQTLQLWRRL